MGWATLFVFLLFGGGITLGLFMAWIVGDYDPGRPQHLICPVCREDFDLDLPRPNPPPVGSRVRKPPPLQAVVRWDTDTSRPERSSVARAVAALKALQAAKAELSDEERAELKHFMLCRTCHQPFDMRDLDQVFAHEHDGPHEALGIVGERVN